MIKQCCRDSGATIELSQSGDHFAAHLCIRRQGQRCTGYAAIYLYLGAQPVQAMHHLRRYLSIRTDTGKAQTESGTGKPRGDDVTPLAEPRRAWTTSPAVAMSSTGSQPDFRATSDGGTALICPQHNREAFELIYNARYRPRRSQSLYRGDVFDAVG